MEMTPLFIWIDVSPLFKWITTSASIFITLVVIIDHIYALTKSKEQMYIIGLISIMLVCTLKSVCIDSHLSTYS